MSSFSLDYTADGYLARVGTSRDQWNTVTDTVEMSGTTWMSEDVRDAAGRVISRWENSGVREGVNTSYSRTSTYDRTGLVLTEQTHTYVDDNIFAGVTAYFRNETVNYSYSESGIWRGAVTSVATSGYRDPWPLGTGSNSNVPMADTTTTYTYQWWDDARLNTIASNTGHTSTFNYDVNGRISTVVIDDDRDRTVTFVTDPNGQVLLRTELDLQTTTGDPKDQYFYFNGQRIGEVTNNGVYTSSYTGEMYNRTRTGPSTPTPFRYGDNPIYNADFDLAYEALTPSSIRSGGSAYTVRTGDTLQGIAAGVWGDSSLWYLIAEANGLTATSLLSAGQTLTIPAKVGNFHNTADTFRPYDPNKALGDLNPTQVKPPKGGGGGCGVVGQIIAVVIAVAIIVASQGAASGIGQAIFGAVGISAPAAGTVGAAIYGATATAVGSAVIGAGASIASQGFLIATGAQDKLDWKQVGISALQSFLAPGGSAPGATASAMDVVRYMASQAVNNVLVQGIAVATGLQHKFDWTGVAVAGVVAGVSNRVGIAVGLPQESYRWTTGDIGKAAFVNTVANAAGAGVRSLIDGTSFGDNMIATLPQTIGQTFGSVLSGYMSIQATKDAYSAEKQQEFIDAHANYTLEDLAFVDAYAREQVDASIEFGRPRGLFESADGYDTRKRASATRIIGNADGFVDRHLDAADRAAAPGQRLTDDQRAEIHESMRRGYDAALWGSDNASGQMNIDIIGPAADSTPENPVYDGLAEVVVYGRLGNPLNEFGDPGPGPAAFLDRSIDSGLNILGEKAALIGPVIDERPWLKYGLMGAGAIADGVSLAYGGGVKFVVAKVLEKSIEGGVTMVANAAGEHFVKTGYGAEFAAAGAAGVATGIQLALSFRDVVDTVRALPSMIRGLTSRLTPFAQRFAADTHGGGPSPFGGRAPDVEFSGRYEANPKHDVRRSGVSPQPTNPESTLAGSVPVGRNSRSRIGYDSAAGEIVVFQNHGGDAYHGYAPSWNALTQAQKNALIRANLFTRRGRPVT